MEHGLEFTVEPQNDDRLDGHRRHRDRGQRLQHLAAHAAVAGARRDQDLPYHRHTTGGGARDQVMKYGGVGVVTEGYFLRVTPEGAESTNCHGTDPANIDYHEWIAAQSTDTRVQAVVVEVTP